MQQTIRATEIKEFPLFEGQQTYERITEQIPASRWSATRWRGRLCSGWG